MKPIIITDQRFILSLMGHDIALKSLQSKFTAEILHWAAPMLPYLDRRFPARAAAV